MRSIILTVAALLATGSAFADDTVATDKTLVHDKTDFFVHLDIAKVLSSTDTYGQCGIIPARLDYLDHQGREHVLDYKVIGQGCPSDN